LTKNNYFNMYTVMLSQNVITPCVQDVMPCCQGNIQGNQSSLPI
jgi:hypothetical protein